MIPIPYFLALFAILVSLMGCTQNAPPGSLQTVASNDKTKLVDAKPTEEPHQSIRHHHDPIVKPSVHQPSTVIELLQPNGARDWKIIFKGVDAEKLYKLMSIKAEDTDREHRDLDAIVKSGKNLDCYKLNQGMHQCEFTLDGITGEMKLMNKKVHTFSPDEVLDENYHSDLLDLDTISNGGKMMFTHEDAQKIFDGMTKVESQIISAAGDFADGKRKKGLNVDCYQQFLKSNLAEPIFSCNFWFLNSTLGEFDKIK